MVLAAIALAAALRAETFCETSRTEGPEGASAITHVSRDVYFCVDDRGGWLHEVTVTVGEGEVEVEEVLESDAGCRRCSKEQRTDRRFRR